eukprot:1739926-Amphidinium_carterae.1
MLEEQGKQQMRIAVVGNKAAPCTLTLTAIDWDAGHLTVTHAPASSMSAYMVPSIWQSWGKQGSSSRHQGFRR